MAYNYETEKSRLFTDEGQRQFLSIRDNVLTLLANAGAVRMQEAWKGFTGETWFMMACVDRLVELGTIREITGDDVAGQHRVFVRRSA